MHIGSIYKKNNRTNTAAAGKTAVACLLISVMLMMCAFGMAGCTSGMGANEEGESNVAALAAQHEAEAAELIENWVPSELTQKWQTNRLVAHGGGGYDGLQTSNSIEAVLRAIDNAYALIELDMGLTSDGKVVMVHDWNDTTIYYYGLKLGEAVSYEQFMSFLTYDKLHPMSLENLIAIFDKSDSFRVITDIKDGFEQVVTAIATEYPEYRDRFTIQIYDFNQIELVKKLGFEKCILTLYTMQPPYDADRIAKFAKEEGLSGVTVGDADYLDGIVDELVARAVTVYRHPISSYERMLQLYDEGVYGIYTSTIIPREITDINANYYITIPDPSLEPGQVVSEKDAPGAKAMAAHGLTGGLTPSIPGTIKLTDYQVQGDTVADIVALQVHGLKDGQYRIYYIGDDGERMTDQGLEELPYGKIHMPTEIYQLDENGVGHYTGITIDYYLWKDEKGVCLIDDKYDYRAMNRKVIPDMKETLSAASPEIQDILSHSLIVHAGDYYYYNNGEPGTFLYEKEYLYVAYGDVGPDRITQKHMGDFMLMGIKENKTGPYTNFYSVEYGLNYQRLGQDKGVYVPVSEVAKMLGARSVEMNAQRQIVIQMGSGNDQETKVEWDFTEQHEYPNMPFLNKTFTHAKYLAKLADRDCLEGAIGAASMGDDISGICIILPEGVKLIDLPQEERYDLLLYASLLYGQK